MASVGARTLADGTVRWRVQARVNDKMHQKTFIAKEGADKFAEYVDRLGWDAAVAVLKTRQGKGRDVPTLTEWVTAYLDPASGMLTGVEDGTRDGYRRAAERSFLPILGELPVDSITKADVGRWIAWQENQMTKWRQGTVSMKTVQNYHAILSAALRAAVDHKLRDDNPAHKTRITRTTRREGVFLTREEFATILHFLPQRYEPLIMFLGGTGCRWGEATAITWGDLHLDTKQPTVRIDKAWKKGPKGTAILSVPKSKKSIRTVSLPIEVVNALPEPGMSDELVFPSRVGTRLRSTSFRNYVWLPTLKRAQDPVLCAEEHVPVLRKSPRIHDLRHSHASWLVADGNPLPWIQARLGHENITTTIGVYGHLQPEAHELMAESANRSLAGVRPLRQIR